MSDPETTSQAPETTPAEPETTPTEPETTPVEPETTPAEPETTPTEPAPAEVPLSLSPSDFYQPAPEPVPEVPLDIAALLSDISIVQQKEAGDASTLASVATMSMDSLRQILIPWAASGFPNAHTIREIAIQPPPQCSDGVTRALADYILFVSGKTLAEHIAVLQARLSGITVSYAWSGYSILIVVSKA